MFKQAAAEPGRIRRPATVAAELRRRNPVLAGLAALQSALLVAFLVGLVADPRTVGAELVWLKPAKFAGGIALLALALGWLGPHFPVDDRTLRRVSLGVAGGSVLEIVLVGGQAARGVESHFNTATALDAGIYYVMGGTVVGIVVLVAWLLARSWRREFEVDPAFAWGIRLGVLLFVVGSFEGGAMVALSGAATGGGPAFPVVGWHLGGDLRMAHFVGIHALEAVPLTGYLAARANRRGRLDRPVLAVVVAAALFAGALAATFAHAVAPLAA